MNEYINKADLYNEIAKLEEMARDRYLDTPLGSPAHTRYQSQLNERTNLKYLIADFPTVDAVEVVRCKDCVKLHTPHYLMWYDCLMCGGQCDWVTDNGFCNAGERRDVE